MPLIPALRSQRQAELKTQPAQLVKDGQGYTEKPVSEKNIIFLVLPFLYLVTFKEEVVFPCLFMSSSH